jgi:hypothetical protein
VPSVTAGGVDEVDGASESPALVLLADGGGDSSSWTGLSAGFAGPHAATPASAARQKDMQIARMPSSYRMKPRVATLSIEVNMNPTMLNINKAKSLLRAMADVSAFKLGAAVSPEDASRKHALGISGDELRGIEEYMSTQGWLDAGAGADGVRTLTQAGLDIAQKVKP